MSDLTLPKPDPSATNIAVPPPQKTRKPRRVATPENVNNVLTELIDQITDLIEDKKTPGVRTLQSIRSKLRTVSKDTQRLLNKKGKRSTEKKGNRTSTLSKEVPVSDKMIEFAKWEKDSKHSRIEVTRFVYAYIKENDLQNPKDRRKIVLDDTLLELLEMEKDSDEAKTLTYFNIQKYLKCVFVV